MKIEIGRDWSEFLRLMISNHVRFVLVGGHAVAGHGEPRLTEDLDILFEPTAKNAARLLAALEQFGFGDMLPDAESLVEPGRIWMLGRKPWRIDLLTEIDGVSFNEVWKGRVRADFDPEPLPVIGLAQLLKNKRASGRPKDLADVARLEELQRLAKKGRRAPPQARPRKRNKKKR